MCYQKREKVIQKVRENIMRITIDFDIKQICRALAYDTRKINVFIEEIAKSLSMIASTLEDIEPKSKEEEAISESKEEEATLNTVKEILKEPVVPVQPKQKKRQWSRKQKEDIEAIKKAYVDRKNEVKPKHNRYRRDIDDYMIVKMRDEEEMSFIAIGKKLKCSPQTAANRYNKAKGISET